MTVEHCPSHFQDPGPNHILSITPSTCLSLPPSRTEIVGQQPLSFIVTNWLEALHWRCVTIAFFTHDSHTSLYVMGAELFARLCGGERQEMEFVFFDDPKLIWFNEQYVWTLIELQHGTCSVVHCSMRNLN